MIDSSDLDRSFGSMLDSVGSKIKKLELVVEKLNNNYNKSPRIDWGYLGSLGHIDQVLGDILSGFDQFLEDEKNE